VNVFQFIVQNHSDVLRVTLEHLWMVVVSIFLAVLVGIPLGILITRWPGLDKPVLGSANIIQTIPSLALFGFLLPVPWIGARADRLAILALSLYTRCCRSSATPTPGSRALITRSSRPAAAWA